MEQGVTRRDIGWWKFGDLVELGTESNAPATRDGFRPAPWPLCQTRPRNSHRPGDRARKTKAGHKRPVGSRLCPARMLAEVCCYGLVRVHGQCAGGCGSGAGAGPADPGLTGVRYRREGHDCSAGIACGGRVGRDGSLAVLADADPVAVAAPRPPPPPPPKRGLGQS